MPERRSSERSCDSQPCVFLLENSSSVLGAVLTADEESSWATIRQTRSATKPETHSNGRAKGNHGDVPAAQASLELTLRAMVDDVSHGQVMLLRCRRHRLPGIFVALAHAGLVWMVPLEGCLVRTKSRVGREGCTFGVENTAVFFSQGKARA